MIKNESKTLIIVDLEGIIGIRDINDTERNIILAYREIKFIIEELTNSGFVNITICNIHNDGSLLLKDEFKKIGVELIAGIDKLVDRIQLFSEAIMIGFHCKKNSGWRYDHTFRNDFDEIIYGQDNIGEVGAYCRWLALGGIPVIFVSGEGAFREEIGDFNCTVHQIIDFPADENIINKEYLLLEKELKRGVELFKNKKISCPIIERDSLLVGINNIDKCTLLRKKFDVSVEEKYIRFSNMTLFFEQLYDLALCLNKAEEAIVELNIRIVNEIKKSNKTKQEIKDLLGAVLCKDIVDVNQLDRNIIAKRMGFHIESLDSN